MAHEINEIVATIEACWHQNEILKFGDKCLKIFPKAGDTRRTAKFRLSRNLAPSSFVYDLVPDAAPDMTISRDFRNKYPEFTK